MIRPLRAIGLDLSLTGTGIAVTHDQLGEPRLSCRTVSPRKRKSPNRIDHERLHETFAAIAAAVQCKPDLIVIEEPLHVDGKGDTSIRLAELHGPIKHWIWSRGIPYVDVHLTKVKTYATGNGNADKPTVFAAAIARYGRLLHIGSYDEADSLTLLAMALDHYGQPLVPVTATSYTRAFVDITWPKLDLQEGGLK
jgi:crossover junction endodeoxyribonuclease RuvC